MPAPITERTESPAYRWYVLAALTLTSLFSVADRLVLSILIEDIKAEFTLSDSELGLLTGVAFSLFYVIFGFPIRAANNDQKPTAAPHTIVITLHSVKAAATMFLRVARSARRAKGKPKIT